MRESTASTTPGRTYEVPLGLILSYWGPGLAGALLFLAAIVGVARRQAPWFEAYAVLLMLGWLWALWTFGQAVQRAEPTEAGIHVWLFRRQHQFLAWEQVGAVTWLNTAGWGLSGQLLIVTGRNSRLKFRLSNQLSSFDELVEHVREHLPAGVELPPRPSGYGRGVR